MRVFKGGPPDKPVILFQYHPTRSGDVAAIFLKGYKGIVQTDGYGGYNFLDDKKDILPVDFWVHIHRKFKEVTKAVGNKRNSSGNAGIALKGISKLYKIEKEARLEELSPDQVYAQRQSTA
jgi:transposase